MISQFIVYFYCVSNWGNVDELQHIVWYVEFVVVIFTVIGNTVSTQVDDCTSLHIIRQPHR
jgi:hypothetical protein